MKLKNSINGKKLYFCSDFHIGHENIIKLSKRDQFSGVVEMNNYIVETLKNLEPTDTLFDLGDMFWKTEESLITSYIASCPARIYKVIGNHDAYGLFYGKQKVAHKWFDLCADMFDINVDYNGRTYKITMSHYPMLSWNHKPRGAFMLHGHCHGNIDSYNNSSHDLRVDVGFDGELAKKVGSPIIPFSEILKHFEEKTGGIEFKNWVMDNCKEL